MAKVKRNRYTDDERASLVAMLVSEGYTGNTETSVKGALRRVSQYAKVPESTLHRWFQEKNNPPPSELVNEKKGNLADTMEDIVWLMLGQLKEPAVIAEMSGKDMATSAAILVDKMRLLRGLPTEIVQVLPPLVEAIESAGLKPSDVFNAMLARLNADAHNRRPN